MQTAKYFSFFDLDDTLVNCKTMFSFQEYWFLNRGSSGARGELEVFNSRVAELRSSGCPREELNTYYYSTFAGRSPEEVRDVAWQWYGEQRRCIDPFYVEVTLDALAEHRRRDQEPVLISGSMVDIIAPIAKELGVEHVLATRLTIDDGRYTGVIVPPQTIGAGKAIAVLQFLSRQGVDPGDCWAYGDHSSDIPMLEAVGNAVVVSDEPSMVRLAEARGWKNLGLRIAGSVPPAHTGKPA